MTGVRHPREEIKAIIEGDKPAYIRTLFDSIAVEYDRMNRIMTGGLLVLWHRAFVRAAGLSPGERALDVCCGTGDLALLLAAQVGPAGRVVGLDFSEKMLAIAAERQDRLPARRAERACRVEWVQGDALSLPFPDGGPAEGFHCTSMGFALRNVGDLARSLREMARVTRRGGRVVCLEVSRPENPVLAFGFNLYFYRLVPLLGRLAEKGLHPDSPLRRLRPYTYLPYSLDHLPSPAGILALMEEAGLRRVRRVPLTGGVVSLYIGEKP